MISSWGKEKHVKDQLSGILIMNAFYFSKMDIFEIGNSYNISKKKKDIFAINICSHQRSHQYFLRKQTRK